VIVSGGYPPPEAAKRGCYICGYDLGDRRFVLTGVVIEFEGMLALCDLCVLEMAELVGAISPHKAERLQERLAVERERADRMEQLLEGLSHVYRIVRTVGDGADVADPGAAEVAADPGAAVAKAATATASGKRRR
jgi:hypothetical protein